MASWPKAWGVADRRQRHYRPDFKVGLAQGAQAATAARLPDNRGIAPAMTRTALCPAWGGGGVLANVVRGLPLPVVLPGAL
jgi:hypothetical protein